MSSFLSLPSSTVVVVVVVKKQQNISYQQTNESKAPPVDSCWSAVDDFLAFSIVAAKATEGKKATCFEIFRSTTDIFSLPLSPLNNWATKSCKAHVQKEEAYFLLQTEQIN